jgi:hypothetical protein
MRLICHLFLLTNLRVYGAVPPFYHTLHCFVLNETDFLNEKLCTVERQCCPVITIHLLAVASNAWYSSVSDVCNFTSFKNFIDFFLQCDASHL